MTYDQRKDVLEVARLTKDDPPGDPLDVEAIVVGAINSLNVVADWIEEGELDDAAELCNYAIDDLEDIIGGPAP